MTWNRALQRTLGLLALLTAPLVGQQTWIIDSNNGPGTHFTDIPPAVSAASDGDTLIIRAGGYSGFSTGKALTLLGEGAPRVFATTRPAIEVTGLARAVRWHTVGAPLAGRIP